MGIRWGEGGKRAMTGIQNKEPCPVCVCVCLFLFFEWRSNKNHTFLDSKRFLFTVR